MITEAKLIDDVFVKEGDEYGDQTTRPPIDQPTARGGITLDTLRAYVQDTGADVQVSVLALKLMSHELARDIVRWKMNQLAKTHRFDQIPYEPLRLQMLDFAYNSGPALAIRWLQRVLGVPRTGVMDPTTMAGVLYPQISRINLWIHQSLMAARLQMIDMATDPGGKVDHKYEEGLENRAFTFSLLEIP